MRRLVRASGTLPPGVCAISPCAPTAAAHRLQVLEVLVLQDNRLSTLSGCELLGQLKELDASRNRLENLPKTGGVLEHMPALETLVLRGNSICHAKSYEAVATRNSVSLFALDPSIT